MFLEEYYNADLETELIGSSVPASEHSVMTSYSKEDEIIAFERLIDQFPSGILSIVSDSFDLWKVCTEFLPQLKEKIMAREDKIVIRPDSGDPVDIICGTSFTDRGKYVGKGTEFYISEEIDGTPQAKGVIELLWDVFGGTINEQGYKVLDSHIGAIYGDSITLERAELICDRLEQKGFASTNIVFGIGSYTFNCNTRDSLGIAVKSTYCEVDTECREIFKDPITDDGTKKSAKGLLIVESGKLYDQVSWSQVEDVYRNDLKTVFFEGSLVVDQSLEEIRNRLWA
jgi:nicotinamide phosphoribosyltransferase